MGKPTDNRKRTSARHEEATQRLLDEGLKLYSLTEIESILSVTHRTLQRWVKSGKLPAVKIGNRWKVSEATLRRFVETGRNIPDEEKTGEAEQ